MRTAATALLATLLLSNSLVFGQRRCCCRGRVFQRAAPRYVRVEPTCGLPAYAVASAAMAPQSMMVASQPMMMAPAAAQPAYTSMAPTPSGVVTNAAPTIAPTNAPTNASSAPSISSTENLPIATPSVGQLAVPVATESVASPSDRITDDALAGDKRKTGDQKTDDTDKKWRSLFNGKELGDWEITKFGGEGEVAVEKGYIFCDYGQYMTGVTYKGKDLPTNNYEIELEAQRMAGQDFFCGLTFPVDKTHATFICGGWGGSVTGISSIDHFDASENDTSGYMNFEAKKWYKVRVRVTKGVLEAWVDDEKLVNKELEASRLSTRLEVDPSKPLGICCFDTQAAYRNIRIRPVSEPDSKGSKSDQE